MATTFAIVVVFVCFQQATVMSTSKIMSSPLTTPSSTSLLFSSQPTSVRLLSLPTSTIQSTLLDSTHPLGEGTTAQTSEVHTSITSAGDHSDVGYAVTFIETIILTELAPSSTSGGETASPTIASHYTGAVKLSSSILSPLLSASSLVQVESSLSLDLQPQNVSGSPSLESLVQQKTNITGPSSAVMTTSDSVTGIAPSMILSTPMRAVPLSDLYEINSTTESFLSRLTPSLTMASTPLFQTFGPTMSLSSVQSALLLSNKSVRSDSTKPTVTPDLSIAGTSYPMSTSERALSRGINGSLSPDSTASTQTPGLTKTPLVFSNPVGPMTQTVPFMVMSLTTFVTVMATAVTGSPTPQIYTLAESTDEASSSSLGLFVPIRCTMILSGDCAAVIRKKEKFIDTFTTEISIMISTSQSRLSVTHVTCGSVVVDFILHDTTEVDLSQDLYELTTGKETFAMTFDGQAMSVESLVFHDGPFSEENPTGSTGSKPDSSEVPPISDGDDGLSFKQQQRLIYIVIAVFVGFVLLLAFILVIHHVFRKVCNKSAQSFDLQEPCIKLTDFNMAHTCIPRPRSIYSSNIGADGTFYRYDNKEDGVHPPGSPTSSFIYANSDEIKEHYHEVIDPEGHVLVSPIAPNTDTFGRSGLPDWNLPLLDGATPGTSRSPDLLTTVESHHSSQPSTSSDTFRPASTSSSSLNGPPTFAPPPPPPPPLPTPVIPSGTLQSRTSCDASSEMTDSSSESNTLTRDSSDVGTSMMGIDNPLMTQEEQYDDIGASTSNRMSKYILR